MKNDTCLNFVVNQENGLSIIYKNLVDSDSMLKEMCKSIKIGTALDAMYGLCKMQKWELSGCPLFRPILMALQNVTYNLVKFLVSTLNFLTNFYLYC